ncbi:hypothetical protein HV824_07450 [Myxococcus sp. AM009]|nr:hypothetical protein [Myxococcus sp. AM009]NVI97954.1 hypothetical protein [Myxococcus sp. AM009]
MSSQPGRSLATSTLGTARRLSLSIAVRPGEDAPRGWDGAKEREISPRLRWNFDVHPRLVGVFETCAVHPKSQLPGGIRQAKDSLYLTGRFLVESPIATPHPLGPHEELVQQPLQIDQLIHERKVCPLRLWVQA